MVVTSDASYVAASSVQIRLQIKQPELPVHQSVVSGEACMNTIIDAGIFLVVLAAVALGLLHASGIDDLRKRTRRLGRIEAKLDLLMKNAGIEFAPYQGLPVEVVDALNRGDKLEAIKFYCSTAGVSLKEAKKFIEDVQRRSGWF